jgi:Protein of unknown function (DUF3052)
MTGYSGTPLAKKLGLKPNMQIQIMGFEGDYFSLFSDFPDAIQIADDQFVAKDLIHFFCKESAILNAELPFLKNAIQPNGMIWVSWPKKASKIQTDITEDTIRNLALSIGLVDVKVCAVDEIWSGLKLVVPVKNRPKNP